MKYVFVILYLFCGSIAAGNTVRLNGFLIDSPLVPASEIRRGGPAKDGIPAIDQPKWISSDRVDYLSPIDVILGINIDGVSRAYPIKVLNWHEVVNDKVADYFVSVTYCPLCGSGIVFFDTEPLDFGVSGLLYNSDVLLYDRHSESLWSQLMGQAINGVRKGEKIRQLPAIIMTWEGWRKRHPDTQVLSLDTGYSRDYQRDPYACYSESRRLYFSVNQKVPDSYHPKERILGVEVNGKFKAYPFSELARHGKARFEDRLAGQLIKINWQQETSSAWLETNTDTQGVNGTVAYWFAWFAFHPDTAVFKGAN